jgi:hypothetical protein
MKTTHDVSVWQEHIAKAAVFPGSNSKYCREAGISKSQFGYWKTKLRSDGIKRAQSGVKTKVSKFIPVEVCPASTGRPNFPEAKWVAEFLFHFMGGVK